jgi:hypothetical protein
MSLVFRCSPPCGAATACCRIIANTGEAAPTVWSWCVSRLTMRRPCVDWQIDGLRLGACRDSAKRMQLRFRERRNNAFHEVEFDDIDEPGADDPEEGIEKLLRTLALETGATPEQVRARAAFVLGPTKLADLADFGEARRQVTAVAAVRDVAVEFFPVADARRAAEIDRPLADRGFGILLLDVDPQDQWAFNRPRDFEERGAMAELLDARELEPLVDKVAEVLRGLVGGPDAAAPADLEHEIASALTESEQNEVRAAVRTGPLRVVFVGGNETQEQYQNRIEAALLQRYGDGVEVAWFGGWPVAGIPSRTPSYESSRRRVRWSSCSSSERNSATTCDAAPASTASPGNTAVGEDARRCSTRSSRRRCWRRAGRRHSVTRARMTAWCWFNHFRCRADPCCRSWRSRRSRRAYPPCQ